MDPRYTMEYDRRKAEELEHELRYESDPNVRKDYQRLANDYEQEAEEIETEIEQEDQEE